MGQWRDFDVFSDILKLHWAINLFKVEKKLQYVFRGYQRPCPAKIGS